MRQVKISFKRILTSVFLTLLSIYFLMRHTFSSKEWDKANKRNAFNFSTSNLAKLEIVKQQDGGVSLLQTTSNSANITGGVFVNTEGRLGNKLFRYACAYTLARRLNISLYLPPTGEEVTALESFNIRDTSIDQFPKIVDYNKTNSQPFKTIYDEDILWYWDRLQHNVNLRYNSFCQSEEYFREYKEEIKAHLRQDLNSQDEENETMKKWLKEIKNSEKSSVAVHIRRGDYLKIKWQTNIKFYVKAINMMQRMITGENITFFIFSDSIQLVKNELENATGNVPWERIHFVSDSKAITSVQEFKLMRNCSNIITSNSSFSWWAAYLMENKDKIVISPAFREDIVKTFVRLTTIKNFNLFLYNSLYYPQEWIVLSKY